MRDFRGLKVWEKAHSLTLRIYETTLAFPRDEQYGLTSQVRRACSSIAANIAEGCGRDSNGELRRFLEIAMGSASELEYHLLLARDLGLLPSTVHGELADCTIEVKRMLATFIRRLRSQN